MKISALRVWILPLAIVFSGALGTPRPALGRADFVHAVGTESSAGGNGRRGGTRKGR